MHFLRNNSIALSALFVALGGTSYAAIALPKNSVGTAQLKKNAVTTAKVKNGSLVKADFKAGQLPAGAQGIQGPKGDKGDPGAPGTNGVNGVNGKDGVDGTDGANAATNVVYRVASQALAAQTGSATATCQEGERLIGGGGGFVQAFNETIDASADHIVSYNGPSDGTNASDASPSGWTVAARNNSAVAARVYSYASCVSP